MCTNRKLVIKLAQILWHRPLCPSRRLLTDFRNEISSKTPNSIQHKLERVQIESKLLEVQSSCAWLQLRSCFSVCPLFHQPPTPLCALSHLFCVLSVPHLIRSASHPFRVSSLTVFPNPQTFQTVSQIWSRVSTLSHV